MSIPMPPAPGLSVPAAPSAPSAPAAPVSPPPAPAVASAPAAPAAPVAPPVAEVAQAAPVAPAPAVPAHEPALAAMAADVVQAAQAVPVAPAAPAAPASPPPAPVVASAPQAAPAAPFEPEIYSQEMVLADPDYGIPVPVDGPTGMVPVPQVDWNAPANVIAAAQGLNFLDFTAFGIFPVITLTNDLKFTLSTGGDLGQEFFCVIHEARQKHLYYNSLPMGHKNSMVAYSYDKQTSGGKPLEPILAQWRAAGYTPVMKTYLELVVRLDDGRTLLLSVPPQSISRFTAFVADTIMAKVLYSSVRCRVFVGEKVLKAAVPFHPIGFEMVR